MVTLVTIQQIHFYKKNHLQFQFALKLICKTLNILLNLMYNCKIIIVKILTRLKEEVEQLRLLFRAHGKHQLYFCWYCSTIVTA